MSTSELKKYYKERVETFFNETKVLDKELYHNSLWRIIVFACLIAGFYFLWGSGPQIMIVFVLCSGVFLWLVKRQLKLKYRRDFALKMSTLNQDEVQCQNKDFKQRYDGAEFNDDQHDYCKDIDLFGKGSFFQYMDRTCLVKSRTHLSQLLKSNETKEVVEKQEVILELSSKAEWRQEFWADAQMIEVETTPDKIITWLKEYKSFIPRYSRMVGVGFAVISVSLITTFVLGLIPEGILVIWLVLGLGISAIFLKKINALSHDTSRSMTTFQQYSKLLERIEKENWTSKVIVGKLSTIQSDILKPSSVIAEFSKQLNALDQRNNLFITIFANGLFLRDILVAFKIENWIQKHKEEVGEWFDVIHFFDVQNSLATFSFNHPSYEFPKIIEQGIGVLDCHSLGHPLLKEVVRVDNDFVINGEEFFIITGANMAGKSTFLRTVSLAIVMGNIGLPICGKTPVYSPIKLVSSMRTSDSLSDEESYFFSELKRLRYIIDKIENERYFIILDEILKGTNSVDKAAGSKKFVERLVKSRSTGIIATHDLSLCETSNQYDEVKNHYFDAQIINDELFFDYTFKKGICQNMNASFLLKKMGIVE